MHCAFAVLLVSAMTISKAVTASLSLGEPGPVATFTTHALLLATSLKILSSSPGDSPSQQHQQMAIKFTLLAKESVSPKFPRWSLSNSDHWSTLHLGQCLARLVSWASRPGCRARREPGFVNRFGRNDSCHFAAGDSDARCVVARQLAHR